MAGGEALTLLELHDSVGAGEAQAEGELVEEVSALKEGKPLPVVLIVVVTENVASALDEAMDKVAEGLAVTLALAETEKEARPLLLPDELRPLLRLAEELPL